MSGATALALLAPEVMPPRVTEVDSEGFVYDVETGEVLGHTEVADDGRVATLEEAEWLLELRSKVEGRIAGLHARREALVANLTAQIAAETKRLSWWDYAHRPRLVDYARAHLPKKGKTWRCAWGRVMFRSNKGTNEIVDMAEAVAYVAGVDESLVKVVRSVGVTAIKEVMSAYGDESVPFMKSSGGGESVVVETGIEIE